MRLNALSPAPGSRRPGKRRGRGIGSGLGKTSGRGQKGQKARSGSAIGSFEGGQTPLHMRMPKRGFSNVRFAARFNAVNLSRLQQAVEAGRLDPASPVTPEALKAAGVIRRLRDGVRLLAQGEIGQALTVEAQGASAAARGKIEAAGGSLSLAPLARAKPAPEAEDRRRRKRRARAAGSGKKSEA